MRPIRVPWHVGFGFGWDRGVSLQRAKDKADTASGV